MKTWEKWTLVAILVLVVGIGGYEYGKKKGWFKKHEKKK